VSRKILKTTAVAKMMGVSNKKIKYMAKSGEFPKPIQIGKSFAWLECEVDAWFEQKIADRDGVVVGGVE
jgi:predicted DNA-binding transcriptional regulator AlpA